MKWWVIALLAIAVATITLAVVTHHGKEAPMARVAKRFSCTFNMTQMPLVTFIPLNERFRLHGDSSCFFTFSYNGEKNGKAAITVETTPLRHESYNITEGGVKYIQEGVYLHVIGIADSGVRVAITRNGNYNTSNYYAYITGCFQNPKCELVCQDLNGVYVPSGSECPEGTVEVSDTDLATRIRPSKRKCCLGFLSKPTLVTSKSKYYMPEFLKVYYLGASLHAPCRFSLISPSGRSRFGEDMQCYSYKQLLSIKLLENLGEEYGNWRAVLKTGNTKVMLPFVYENVPLQVATFELPYNSSHSLNFVGHNYKITHLSGCGGTVELEVSSEGGYYERFKTAIGDSLPIGNGVSLILYGASCHAGMAVITLMRVAAPKCPNGFCEAGESRSKCPWDCLNATNHEEAILQSHTKCTKGCYYNSMCLAEGSLIDIKGIEYQCKHHKLEAR